MPFNYKSKQFKSIPISIFLLVLSISITSFSIHKYYVSISKIEINKEEQLLKVYSKVFVDDFDKVLSERYNLEVTNFDETTDAENQQIAVYLNQKVKLAVNRIPVKINFLGCQLENDYLYLYYEAPFKKQVQRLDIENTLLMDLFTEQQNTVDVTLLNTVKSVHLTHQNIKKTLFF